MATYIDQMGRSVVLDKTPQRIVSIVPSQTELLYHLDVRPIAQTLFCVHPKSEFKSAAKIGGTKRLNIDAINRLHPDLIIGNKEENDQEQIALLEQHYPVWMSDIYTLNDALDMITSVGEIVGREAESVALALEIQGRFNRLISFNSIKKKALYLIWEKPYYGVGSHTFIHDLLQRSGFENVLANEERYPEVSLDKIHTLQPDFIFLSSEPFPFKEKHREAVQNNFPDSKVVLVDGEFWSWYGSRLLLSPTYIQELHSSLGLQSH